jgi:HEAT repeat protein
LQNDSNFEVNASAAAALGKFVLLGELEEIPEESANMVQDLLINEYIKTENDFTKQRILESLGYSSNEKINQFISNAIKKDDKKWQLSALFAISRSANNIWEKIVVEKLSDLDPDIQIEAIKAAGELEIESSKELIIEYLESSSPDKELHMQAIWALSKIGGNDIKELFEEMIEESDDDEKTEILEMAMDNLDLTNGMPSFGLFDHS